MMIIAIDPLVNRYGMVHLGLRTKRQWETDS